MSKPTLYTAKTLEDPTTIDFDTAVEAIKCGTIDDEHGLMRWGSNYTFVVNVRHNGKKFLGVYKPRRGERPLWDFPDGTLCQREAAAYVISEMLGWYVVPPTLLRDGPRGIGSIQVFINHDPNEHYFTFNDPDLANYDDIVRQLQRMTIFDAITNNADRKGGHCLLDETGHIWGIDHGLTFNTQHKLRTVIWDFAGQPIQDDMLDDLVELCAKLDDDSHEQTQELANLLNRAEFSVTQTRVNRLINQGIYPIPGPGPNRPWPAV